MWEPHNNHVLKYLLNLSQFSLFLSFYISSPISLCKYEKYKLTFFSSINSFYIFLSINSNSLLDSLWHIQMRLMLEFQSWKKISNLAWPIKIKNKYLERISSSEEQGILTNNGLRLLLFLSYVKRSERGEKRSVVV
jgi:hypothetical protein